MSLEHPWFLGYPKDNFGILWQSWTTLIIMHVGAAYERQRGYVSSHHDSILCLLVVVTPTCAPHPPENSTLAASIHEVLNRQTQT